MAGRDKEPYYDTFRVPDEAIREATVMDALNYISENIDPTLAYYRHSACNHGICGRCVLEVNGKPALACEARIDSAIPLVLKPVPNRGVVRDLVAVPG